MLPRKSKLPATTSLWILAAVLLSALITETTQQVLNRIDVTPEEAATREGESLTILCRAPQPIIYCRVAVQGEPIRILQQGSVVDGFEYVGAGLQTGQCGVKIHKVLAKHNGDFECSMAIGSQEVTGRSRIIVGKSPDPPQMEVNPQPKNGAYELNTEFSARCLVRGGRPAANISWFLGGDPIVDGLHQAEIVEIGDSFTISQVIERKLVTEDDAMSLSCRAEHFANPQQFSETRHQFVIRYRPQPLPNQRIEGLVIGRTGMLNVTFRSNPRPTVQWYVEGQSVSEGQQNGRYEATAPLTLGAGQWQATLIVADLTLEDTTREYVLKASNEFGATEYLVYIGPSDDETSASLALGWIILIVILCLIVLLSAILVVVARKTGRWCFAERNSAPIAKPAETSDTESVEAGKKTKPEPKAPKLKRPNLNFNAIFKKPNKNAKTDTTAELPHGQEANRDSSEETVVITDEIPEKKDGDIVYAELMLKPPSSDSRTPDSKAATEYAEIVYVNPAEKK